MFDRVFNWTQRGYTRAVDGMIKWRAVPCHGGLCVARARGVRTLPEMPKTFCRKRTKDISSRGAIAGRRVEAADRWRCSRVERYFLSIPAVHSTDAMSGRISSSIPRSQLRRPCSFRLRHWDERKPSRNTCASIGRCSLWGIRKNSGGLDPRLQCPVDSRRSARRADSRCKSRIRAVATSGNWPW